MKNTNGLSTMNQGGDDLAIKIAACKKDKVSGQTKQVPQHIIYSHSEVSQCILEACTGREKYLKPNNLDV